MEAQFPRKNGKRRRWSGVRCGVSLEEGARGGVGSAKQNIAGSKRPNFCAGAASPTSPDRLKSHTSSHATAAAPNCRRHPTPPPPPKRSSPKNKMPKTEQTVFGTYQLLNAYYAKSLQAL